MLLYFSFLHSLSFFIRNLFIRVPRLKKAKKEELHRNHCSHAGEPKNSSEKDFLQGSSVLFLHFLNTMMYFRISQNICITKNIVKIGFSLPCRSHSEEYEGLFRQTRKNYI